MSERTGECPELARFNEAPAKSGGEYKGTPLPVPIQQASMRPPRKAGGNLTALLAAVGWLVLQ